MPNRDYQKLRECPFCGGEAELVTKQQCLADAYTVRCKNAGCRGRTTKLVRAKHQAINEWNRRADK